IDDVIRARNDVHHVQRARGGDVG
ncbi:MAG: hypothetical protein QOG08_1610, partial [Chloroflexota bacterium]|nr:hypothetical protein [Chloroflexota bacterium]